jgi:hypothetical protein
VETVEPPAADAIADRVARQPAALQLGKREHAPLLGRTLGDEDVGTRGAFVGSWPTNPPRVCGIRRHATTVAPDA